MPSEGKRETGAGRGKTCSQCQVQEYMYLKPLANAGIVATGAKGGKCPLSHDQLTLGVVLLLFFFLSYSPKRKL